VTALTPELLAEPAVELDVVGLALVVVELAAGVDVVELAAGVVVAGVVVVVVAERTVAVRCRASAGSWPVTSSSVMSIQRATNMASEAAITRRRIIWTRASRACRRPDAAGTRGPTTRFGVMSVLGGDGETAWVENPPPASQASEDQLRSAYEDPVATSPRSKRQPLK
jgi:hypothetical protein